MMISASSVGYRLSTDETISVTEYVHALLQGFPFFCIKSSMVNNWYRRIPKNFFIIIQPQLRNFTPNNFYITRIVSIRMSCNCHKIAYFIVDNLNAHMRDFSFVICDFKASQRKVFFLSKFVYEFLNPPLLFFRITFNTPKLGVRISLYHVHESFVITLTFATSRGVNTRWQGIKMRDVHDTICFGDYVGKCRNAGFMVISLCLLVGPYTQS